MRSPDPQLARDWRARLDRFGRSELTIAEFCQLEGYSTASFYQWRRRLQHSPSPRTPAFVPVDLTDEVVDPPARASIRIELPGGAVVQLPAGMDVDQQRHLIIAIVQATSGEVPA